MTDDQSATIARPQPLGAFPLPAGLLLISGEGSDSAREELLAGRLPATWPASLEGQRLAYAGDVAAAAQVFAADDSPVAHYNLFVLDPERVSRSEAAAALGDDWAALVDYVAFSVGLTSIPPTAAHAAPEVAALLWTAQAAAALDDGEEFEAIDLLAKAADAARDTHPAFAGTVLSELAGRAHMLTAAQEAVTLLRGTDLPGALAEALYQRAGLIHGEAIDGHAPMSEAISGYNEALKLINERDNTPLFARIHMNLGIALLAQPLLSASDHLRAGIAVQSLRTAQRLLDQETDAEEWASATLNLANALVYAPSARQRDNVMEAIDLYEKVVRTRSPKKDPTGRARVLANQGNALAHLGLGADARGRFDEAVYLFASAGDEGSAQLVRDLVTQLDQVAS